MVGDTYTQVLSGLSDGQSIVLADYAEAGPVVEHRRRTPSAAVGGGRRLRRRRLRWRRRTFRERISGAVARAAAGSPSGADRSREPHAATRPAQGGTVATVAAIRLDQVNLVVHDVAASRAFYSRLGLRLR